MQFAATSKAFILSIFLVSHWLRQCMFAMQHFVASSCRYYLHPVFDSNSLVLDASLPSSLVNAVCVCILWGWFFPSALRFPSSFVCNAIERVERLCTYMQQHFAKRHLHKLQNSTLCECGCILRFQLICFSFIYGLLVYPTVATV